MEEFNKNKIKIYLGVVGIILVITIIFVGIYIIGNTKNQYLLIGENLILEKKGSKWIQKTEFTNEITKNKFIINDGNTIYKDATFDNSSNHYYFLDNNFNEIKNVRIAYSNIENLPLANYKKDRCDNFDTQYFEVILKDKGIKDINRFITGCTKTYYDMDNDGEEETIFTSTNRGFEKIQDEILGLLFVVKNNKIEKTYTKISKDSYRIVEILDLNNNGKFDVIINRKDIDVSTLDSCYQIYEIDNNKWELKQDCQV
ncbi:MAG: hypothetical protein HFJ17_05340 [Clostridia bacterium]|nr:hypothetical protein [Clostridia bacterium]